MSNAWQAILHSGKLVIASFLFAIAAVTAGLVVFGSSQQTVVIATVAAAVSALFTAFTAFATIQLAIESQKQREEQKQQRIELAFQAAIVEVAGYIGHFNRWYPASRSASWPNNIWWVYPMRFNRLTELMEVVLFHPKLWERIIGGSLLTIQWLEKDLNDSTEKIRGTTGKPPLDKYFVLDLYLKQLARYIICEMRRQNQSIPKGVQETKFFQPLAWNFDMQLNSPKEKAQYIESKFMPSWLPEIEDSPFRECLLEVLVDEAQGAFMSQSRSKEAT